MTLLAFIGFGFISVYTKNRLKEVVVLNIFKLRAWKVRTGVSWASYAPYAPRALYVP